MPSVAPVGAFISSLILIASVIADQSRGATQRFSVGRVARDYVDSTRQAWDRSGPRPLAVLIWYPAAPGALERDYFLGPAGQPLFRPGRSATDATAASSVRRPLILLSRESYNDPRIRAVAAIAPVTTWLSDSSLRDVVVPVSIVVGTHDAITTPNNNARRAAQLIPGARLLEVDDVGHYTFLAVCEPAGKRLRPDLCAERPGVDRARVHDRVADHVTAFFNDVLQVR